MKKYFIQVSDFDDACGAVFSYMQKMATTTANHDKNTIMKKQHFFSNSSIPPFSNFFME